MYQVAAAPQKSWPVSERIGLNLPRTAPGKPVWKIPILLCDCAWAAYHAPGLKTLYLGQLFSLDVVKSVEILPPLLLHLLAI